MATIEYDLDDGMVRVTVDVPVEDNGTECWMIEANILAILVSQLPKALGNSDCSANLAWAKIGGEWAAGLRVARRPA